MAGRGFPTWVAAVEEKAIRLRGGGGGLVVIGFIIRFHSALEVLVYSLVVVVWDVAWGTDTLEDASAAPGVASCDVESCVTMSVLYAEELLESSRVGDFVELVEEDFEVMLSAFGFGAAMGCVGNMMQD